MYCLLIRCEVNNELYTAASPANKTLSLRLEDETKAATLDLEPNKAY